MYDYYCPGYEDSVPLGHNTVCLLTEVAARQGAPARSAETPVDRARRQVDRAAPVAGRPLDAARHRRLRPQRDARAAARRGRYRSELVRNFYDMGRRAIEAGARETPFAFVIPPEQHDVLARRKLEELLLAGGVEIQRAQEPFRVEQTAYPAGTD